MQKKYIINDRHLDTLQRPYITIINELPENNPHFSTTRIDISDCADIKKYIHNPYISDDSTKALYAQKGIRFSFQTHKTINEYERLGLNNRGDIALIACYVHGSQKNSLKYLFIGKGLPIQFGDTITFTTKQNTIIIIHNNKELPQIEGKDTPDVFGLPARETFDKLMEFLQLNPSLQSYLNKIYSVD